MSDATGLAREARPTPQHLYRQIVRIRRFEEKCAELYSAGKIRGFLHLCIGEEAVSAGIFPALSDDDAVVTGYRDHGHALARGVPANAIMAEMFAKVEGCSRGRGGSMHLFDVRRRFYGGNAIVAGGLPIAVGLALADKMLRRPRVTACIFGDGATAEGEFHESMNLAALWKLPVLFICENNRYAMGTALERHSAQTNIALKATAYAMPSEQADGMDVEAVYRATARAASLVRQGDGPYFLELLTYRFRPHSMFDPDLYRTRAEVELWKKRDPAVVYRAVILDRGLASDSELAAIEREVEEELASIVAYAEAGTLEPVTSLLDDVTTKQEVGAV
jgi:pyruvate dehydrogenase E1 component alpha subunit